MLNWIIRYSLNHRMVTVALTALVIIYGLFALSKLPVDVFPDITKPTVTVMTEAHGLAPEEVESRVTAMIEAQLSGVPGVERIRSQSGIGLSAIYVEFQWGVDIYRSRQLVQERLNLAKERLPRDVVPVMGPVGSLMGQIQQIAVTSRTLNPVELRSFAEWVLRPRLTMIPGVAQVISIGGGLKQYQVLASAEKLNRFQVSMEQVDRVLSQISQNTTGGFLEKGTQEFLIRNIGVVQSVEDIENTLIGLHFGRPVLIKDIAEVKVGHRLKRGDGSFNGEPAVIMTIQKQPGADTVQITHAVDAAIEGMQSAIPKGVVINASVFKQANFIEASIDGIKGKLRWGTVLVFVILLIFLANLRMSVVTLTAIPVSFLMTAVVFWMFGLTVNTMTLGGLAIAIGELVDDSIVDVENVFRRLKENARLIEPRSRLRVIYEASMEVRNSIVLATGIIALVFLPVFNLQGLEGRMFVPLGFAYLTALLASLVVSLTITPVLCSFILRVDKADQPETRFVQVLKRWDRRVLDWALPHSGKVLGVALVLFVSGLVLIPFMGRDFLPQFNEGTAMISVATVPGVSLTESNRIGLRAEELIAKSPEVKSTSRRTGRAELDEHAMGVHVSEIDVDFNEGGRGRAVVLDEIRDRLKDEFPLFGVSVGQPLSHLIDHMLSGVSAALAIKVFGPDLRELRRLGHEVKQAIEDVPGLVDLKVETQGLIPQVKVHVLRADAAKWGLSPGEVTTLLEAALNGQTVGQIIEGTQVHDVFFQFDSSSKTSIESIEKMVLKIMPDGRRVLLGDVADVYESDGPNEINRENGQRRMVISGNASGRDLGSLVKTIETQIKTKIKLPDGYYVVYGGQFENQQRATEKILLFGLLALIGIAAILYGHFRSKMIAAQIMVTIPLAFTGGMICLFIAERTITVASLIGFITLCGVASRNGIMMIDHYLHLMANEGESFTHEMIVRGSQERLIPVMMTALVASLALLPLVFAKGQPGSEVLYPVALVIVGGLVSSTLLDMIVTPALFFRVGRKSAEAYVARKNEKGIVL
ncbi:MAG: efflux RND transporter permease subunit [Bdellovibrionaceae bacterium]|nr:efflux RND transporter permease subunit [Pseudobdellovibrionaceae bacterium]